MEVRPVIARATLCLAALSGAFALGADTAGPSFFKDEPADSLIRQLEAGPAPSVEGLAARREHRWLPELGMLLIETTLANPGNAPVKATDVPLADLAFRIAAPGDAAYRPLTYRDDTWYGSTYWTGPDWTRVGRDWHHPGERTPSVRRFTCPRDGKVTVTGRVAKAHVDPKTDGVRLLIRHGDKAVWQAEIDGGDAKGVEPSVTLDVRKGDAIRFIVHKRKLIFCDTTRWDPTVAYADGETFVASKGFSTQKQGEGGWSYEMEADDTSAAGLPTVHALGRDFALRHHAVAVGGDAAFASKETLPLFVLADGRDASGIAVAVVGGGAWAFRSALAKEGRLRVGLVAGDLSLEPGESVRLPQVAFGAYRGGWAAGIAALQRLVDAEAPALKAQLADAFRQAVGPGEPPELALWTMILDDWWRQDGPIIGQGEVRKQIDKALALVAELQAKHGPEFLAEERRRLEGESHSEQIRRMSPEGARRAYVRVRWLKRQIALANPLLPRGPLLFVKRVPTSYSHLVMQYFGWRARPGGGLFVLERPGRSLLCRDLLGGKLASGNILEPRLSYDAKRVVFSYSNCSKEDPFYHIFEANIDGGDGEPAARLRQLTSGEFEDLMPSYLPDGGIVFCSTRRKGHARCFGGQFGPRWHVYTLHRMDADGSNLRTLSFHETNEWFPTVAPTGHILYSRWDYVDRHPVVHQTLWACRPDGTNPVALWGNHTETPHCTFQLQPVPGTTKVVFTASAHHSITGGSIALVDTRLGNNGEHALTRITPEVRFPEAEGGISEYYDSPWPLSEDYFLVAYSPTPLLMEPRANDPAALGLSLLDRWGNRELLYRDPAIGSSNAIPLAPRAVPPILPSALQPDDPPTGEMVLLDVYEGLGDVPRGTIKALRIVQILPKTTPVADGPRVGLAGQEPTRAVLGTVPVEADGSARFLVPACKPILFQALDAQGFAVQTMRSLTYLQPGEQATCIGCHEHRMSAPPGRVAQALLRPPSAIEPGPDGTMPFSFMRLVQPVLDRHCVRCHSGEKPAKGLDFTATPHDGFTRSYWSLCGGLSFWHGGTNPRNAAEALVPRYGGWNPVHLTAPGGAYGARGSRLMKTLLERQGAARPPAEDLARLALWIDCNAIFYGVYAPADQARQLRGEALPMPAVQ